MAASRATVHLVDGSTYVFRAYHAVRNLSNRDGLPTNAIFGFTQMLLKLIETETPTHLGIVMDPRGPSFRQELFPAYKAHRPPTPEDLVIQFPYIRRVVHGFRIPFLGKRVRRDTELAMKNFYRHPGTNLYDTMIDGTDSYRVVLVSKPPAAESEVAQIESLRRAG